MHLIYTIYFDGEKYFAEIRFNTKKNSPDTTVSGRFRHLSTVNYEGYCRNF